jgi:class 3 adenylate cyclase
MAVNTAARVMSLADGGEIVATDTFADVSGAPVSESRPVELKGLSEPTHVVDVLWRSVSDQGAPEITPP